MPAVIQVEHLRKVYGQVVAVDDVSFEVERGEIFGMVGPNGAGKTSTVECAEGLRAASSGTIRVLGMDPQGDKYRVAPAHRRTTARVGAPAAPQSVGSVRPVRLVLSPFGGSARFA